MKKRVLKIARSETLKIIIDHGSAAAIIQILKEVKS